MSKNIAVIGAGPAGLMAAETLAGSGHSVIVYERMPSPARKLLMAGRGGLNLTHSEPMPAFLAHYGGDEGMRSRLADAIAAFAPDALISWAHGLGQETFTGSSGRIFPKAMKSSTLLRAWLRRLESQGVRLRTRHEWRGWCEDGRLRFVRADGSEDRVAADATLLALGGASWPRLGSTGDWLAVLAARGVASAPFAPSNCGVTLAWSELFRTRFAGKPLKRIALACAGVQVRGEALVTATGLEGGAVYALSDPIRRALASSSPARLTMDLRPDLATADLVRKLSLPRQKQSASTFLRKATGLPPVAIALLREATGGALPIGAYALADLIKAVPLDVTGMAGIERAISTVGGVALDAIDDRFMLTSLPGVFVAGEMLDWDAPTGGYLLQACFATGVAAAHGIEAWLAQPSPP